MISLTEKAFQLAFYEHRTQTRKTAIAPGWPLAPYISHLMEVTGMVSATGGNEITVAAALLHDVVEDCGPSSAQHILDDCGWGVLNLVRECTEPGTEGTTKAPWKERKVAYLEHMMHASLEAVHISVADKLQSAREVSRQFKMLGNTAYEPFVKKEYKTIEERKFATLWFQQALVRVYRARMAQDYHPGITFLVNEFEDIVTFLADN